MERYVCQICGHVYNPEKGEPLLNIKPGVDFSTLPADFECPVCGAAKAMFKPE